MKIRYLLLAPVIGAALLVATPRAQAQTTGTTNVVLQPGEYLNLLDNTPTLTFTPTGTDYDAGTMQKTGAAGIQLRLRTNALLGANITVSASAVSSRDQGLLPGDIDVRSTTPGGVSTYFMLSTTPQLIWNTDAPKPEFTSAPDPIQVDVRLNNLRSYAPGSNDPSNILTFTAAPNVGSGV